MTFKWILVSALLVGAAFAQGPPPDCSTTGVVTTNIGLRIPVRGCSGWDSVYNNDLQLIDDAIVSGSVNAATLQGGTWGTPGTIGSTTPNSGVFTTLASKVINGVSHSELYTGATLDVRVNACIIDAETHANGNTSGVCDSTGEAVTQTIAAQMNIGDVSFDPVEWRLPPKCLWSTSNAFSGGTGVAILQYAGTKISGGGAQEACIIENNSGTNRMKALYLNSGDGYYEAGGFKIRNRSFTFASNGPTMWIQYGYDNSYFHDIEVQNYMASGPGIMIGNNTVADNTPCCAITFARVTSYGNNTGGIPLDIEAISPNGNTNGLHFFGLSLGHPAAGQPMLKINNTYSAINQTGYNFYGLYEEGNTADTTTAFNQITANGSAIVFSGVEVKAETSSSTAPIFSLNGTTPNFVLTGLSTPLNFTQPVVAVLNNVSGVSTSTDANGNLASYTTKENAEKITVNAPGLASSPGLLVSGAPYTAGTATTNFPQVYLNQGTGPSTFSANGTELGINSPSGFAGNFLDLHANGGGSIYQILSSGSVSQGAGTFLGWNSRTRILGGGTDGILQLTNNATNGFTRLQLGLTTSSGPAFCISGTTITTCLGDGTAGGTFVAPTVNVTGLAASLPVCTDGSKNLATTGCAGAITQIYLTSAYTNATTTASNLTDGTHNMAFAVLANQNYKITCDLTYQGSAVTSGLEMKVTGPASPTAVNLIYDSWMTAVSSHDDAQVAFAGTLGTSTNITATTNLGAHLVVSLANGANAGTVQIQGLSAGTGTVTVQPGGVCQMSAQ